MKSLIADNLERCGSGRPRALLAYAVAEGWGDRAPRLPPQGTTAGEAGTGDGRLLPIPNETASAQSPTRVVLLEYSC